MKRRRQAGFSLVELLIGLMLTALILQAIPPLLSTAFVSWRQSVARTATHQSARGGQPTPLTQDMVSELRFCYKPPHLLVIDLTLTDRETGVSDSLSSAVTCLNLPD